jgi:hypothetical protein
MSANGMSPENRGMAVTYLAEDDGSPVITISGPDL